MPRNITTSNGVGNKDPFAGGLLNGDITFASNAYSLLWSGLGGINFPADGSLRVSNAAGTAGYRITANSATTAVVTSRSGGSGQQFWAGAFGVTNGTGALNRPVWDFSNGLLLDPTQNIKWSASANQGTATNDTGLERLAAAVVKVNDGSTGGGYIQQAAGQVMLAASGTNATTTFATTGLTANVVSGRKYAIRMVLYLSNSTAADGAKVDFSGGSAAATDFRASNVFWQTGTATPLQHTQTTALATAITQGTITGQCTFVTEGTFVPSGSGTFIPRYAMNAATTGTLTIQRGSYLQLFDMA